MHATSDDASHQSSSVHATNDNYASEGSSPTPTQELTTEGQGQGPPG